MKILCTNFLKRNLAFARLAILANLEYRLNFFIDAIAQPIFISGIEVVLWITLFKTTGSQTLAGFNMNSYLAYAMWAGFFSRISSNWMYEFRMIFDIESGGLNSILTRPMSYFEYYLSQFLGYKATTLAFSFLIPMAFSKTLDLPFYIERLPLAIALVFLYLVFLFMLSFIVAAQAFHLTRVGSITVAKNFFLMLLSGELFPLDMLPPNYKDILLLLPFVNGTFIPTAYLIGRCELSQVFLGVQSVCIGIIILIPATYLVWKKGVSTYLGTGA